MASPSLLNGPPRKDYAHIALQNQGSLQRSSKQFMRVGYNLSTTPVLPLSAAAAAGKHRSATQECSSVFYRIWLRLGWQVPVAFGDVRNCIWDLGPNRARLQQVSDPSEFRTSTIWMQAFAGQLAETFNSQCMHEKHHVLQPMI